jgi:hypothetical protein
MVRILLGKGVNIDAQGERCRTAVELTCQMGCRRVEQVLRSWRVYAEVTTQMAHAFSYPSCGGQL